MPTETQKDPEQHSIAQPLTLLRLLWRYRAVFLRYRRRLLLGIFCLVLVNGLGILIPWHIKTAVDTLQAAGAGGLSGTEGPDAWAAFYQPLWWIAALALAVLVSRVASRIFLLGAGRRVEADFRNRLYRHLLKMPTDYYAAHPPGELMSRLTNDVDATKYLTGGGIMMGVNTLLAYLTAIPMMLKISWPLTLAMLLFYPLAIWIMGGISRKVRRGYYEVQEVLADISTVAQENLGGMMVIQSYAREEQEAKRFEAIGDRYFGTYTRLIHERIVLFMVLAGLSGLSMLLVMSVGGWQVIAGRMDWGGFVAFTMYLEHMAWPTMALGWTVSIFQQGTAALERINEVLSTPSATTSANLDADAQSDAEPAARGDIEIRDLTFAYRNPYQPGSADSQPVLSHVSLEIRAGETIALVGPVGSGKSTLLRLLPRLYDVPENSIFLDGQDITSLDPGTLRQSMVLMPQLSFLFSTTVGQNIAFGRPDLLEHPDGEAGLVPVAELAGVHADIEALPKQYRTLVGERGLMLSGGQRQRVALARTMLMEAPVLILDDPFSNIDAETERTIVSALRERKAFRQKTTLIATHRFSLVSLCDRIILMDAGQVLAIGTHDEMMRTQPLYQRLHRLQELRSTLGDWEITPDAASNNIGGLD